MHYDTIVVPADGEQAGAEVGTAGFADGVIRPTDD
jgi:hypothetical protein